MIGIIDYRAGNLFSVKKAFEYLGYPSTIVSSPQEMTGVRYLIVPGVGSFGYAINELQTSGLYATIRDWATEGRPFLGICLGMQLLFDTSEESPGISGLGICKGSVRRFTHGKIPHTGWNRIAPSITNHLCPSITAEYYFYFVHSYYVVPESRETITGLCVQQIEFAAMIESGSIFGTQFHPEKSGEAGLELLRRWRNLW